jgi:glycosidase
MIFNFDHNWCNNIRQIENLDDLKVNVVDLKKAFNKWIEGFRDKRIYPLNWMNHDQPRLVSQYGSRHYHKESAKMLAGLVFLMKGVPFIYNGEEIGMTNYDFKQLSDFDDVSAINRYNSLKKEHSDWSEDRIINLVGITSRDNPRTIMQWSGLENAGFSEHKPWFNVNDNYKTINVSEEIKDKDSILNFYRSLIDLRKNSEYSPLFLDGRIDLLDLDNNSIFSYIRTNSNIKVQVVCNFEKYDVFYHLQGRSDKVILSNYKSTLIFEETITLRAYEFVCLLIK